MNNRYKRNIHRQLFKKVLITLAVLALLTAQHAFGQTAANTQITNTVIVSYTDAFGGGPVLTETASVTVEVILVPAAPTLWVTTADIDTAYANTDYTLSYWISSNANGEDSYDLAALEIGGSADLSGPTLTIPAATDPISLGGTTIAANAAAGASTFTVPYDATGAANIVNGIEVGEYVVIDGDTDHPYEVQTITHNSASNTTAIIINGVLDANVQAGDLVGEYAEFDITVHTGALLNSAISAAYTIQTTATTQDTAGNHLVATQQDHDSLITLRLLGLTVNKYVRNTDPANTSGSGAQTIGGRTYYAADVNGIGGDVLEYVIVVENPIDASLASNVVIEDEIPPFTTYVSNSMQLDGVNLDDDEDGGDSGEYDSSTRTIYIYAGDTPGNDGGITGGFDDGSGGSLAQGASTIGVFQVTID